MELIRGEEYYPLSTSRLALTLGYSWHTVQQYCLELLVKRRIDRLEVAGSHVWVRRGSYSGNASQNSSELDSADNSVNNSIENFAKPNFLTDDAKFSKRILPNKINYAKFSVDISKELNKVIDKAIGDEIDKQMHVLQKQLEELRKKKQEKRHREKEMLGRRLYE